MKNFGQPEWKSPYLAHLLLHRWLGSLGLGYLKESNVQFRDRNEVGQVNLKVVRIELWSRGYNEKKPTPSSVAPQQWQLK